MITDTRQETPQVVKIDVLRRYTNVVVIYTARYSLTRDFVVSTRVRVSHRDEFARSELPGQTAAFGRAVRN